MTSASASISSATASRKAARSVGVVARYTANASAAASRRDPQLLEGQLPERGLERLARRGGDRAEGATAATDVPAGDDGYAAHVGGLGAHAPEPPTAATRARSSATSASVRSLSGGRTGPAGRPTTFSPAFTMATAYPGSRSRR